MQEPGAREAVIKLLWEKQFEGSPWQSKFHLIRLDSLNDDYGALADKIIATVRASIEDCFELIDRRQPAADQQGRDEVMTKDIKSSGSDGAQKATVTTPPDAAGPQAPGSGSLIHASDCATNNAPALPPGPCDCSAREDHSDRSHVSMTHRVLDWIGYVLAVYGPWSKTCNARTRFGSWCLRRAGGYAFGETTTSKED